MNKKTVTRLACLATAAMIMSVTLSLAPGAVQPVQAGGSGCGTIGTGRITDGDYSYYAYWHFSGKANDKVTITMTRTSGSLSPMVSLYFSQYGNSDFKWLTSAESVSGSSSAIISNFTLPNTGTYSVITWRSGGRNGTTTGDYNITVACTGAPSGVTANNSCPQRGDPVVWEGMIKSQTDNSVKTKDGDVWAFQANSGARVRLDLIPVGFEPILKLYRFDSYNSKFEIIASGILVPQHEDGSKGYSPSHYFIDKTLDNSGCYYVWIDASSASYAKTGDYDLEFRLK